MKVILDVYTKDVDAALATVKVALESGATDVRLFSSLIVTLNVSSWMIT